eukprot:TRINITY_DN12133_c1_g1_i1.p4 TRINITY_DN12133_c1_g1~~TRINITY_DN12133_c1_g1_i1.p4  ORF type:complete len:111 (-),score=4.30 TRINITY_DN12133_c1_g1_i1:385-717(-)
MLACSASKQSILCVGLDRTPNQVILRGYSQLNCQNYKARYIHKVKVVNTDLIYRIAEETPDVGQVEAPIWIVVGSAVLVTIGSLLAAFLLKPGIDAAEKMQERDSRKWNK